MNMPKKFVLAVIAALAAVSASHAQQIVAQPGQRVLGERYVDAAYGRFDISDLSSQGNAYSLGVNVPLVANLLDAGLNFGANRVSESGVRITDQTVTGSVAVYTRWHGVKPFAEGVIALDRFKVKGAGFDETDNLTLYSVGAGVQIPFKSVWITPSLSSTDSSDEDSTSYVNYGLQVAYLFTPKLSGYAAYTRSEPRRDGDFNVSVVRVGVRFKF